MVRLYVVLKIGCRPESGGDVIAASADAGVLHRVKAAMLRQAEERLAEATGLGDPVLALVETERVTSLRRLLDALLPDRNPRSRMERQDASAA
jgi:hypothetical protein